MRIAPPCRPLIVALVSLLVLPRVMLALGLTFASATDVVTFAIAAMGLNILVREAGLVSFGHGAFFGLASQAAALAQHNWFPEAMIAPSLFALAVVAIFGALAGLLILRRGGIYFPLMTFALPAFLIALASGWSALTGLPSGHRVIILPDLGIGLGRWWAYYALVAAIGFAVVVLLWSFHRSRLAGVLVAIRENEPRARHIGYATDRTKLAAFTLSAVLSGLAGVLWAFHHRAASNGPISIVFSGALLAMIVLGGKRVLLGPALGALIFVLFRDGIGIWAPAYWLMLPVLLFFGFVIFFPDGLAGLIARWLPPWLRAPGSTASAQVVAGPEAPLPAALAAPPGKSGAVLIARELAKSFGAQRAVAGVDIVIEEETLHALVGPNGAGKTTLLDLLSGACPPDAGFVTVAGRALAGRAPEQFARAGVGRSFRIPNLFGNLTVAENVRLAVQAVRLRRSVWWASAADSAAVEAETAALLRYFGLAEFAASEAALLAPAAQRRLDIALALAAPPRVLLLDEPLAGLAATERARLAALIKDMSRHIPILSTARETDPVSASADVVTRMRGGRVQVTKSSDAGPGFDAPPSAAGATTLLAVQRVETLHGRTRILNGISLDVSENEIVALLGRNGAGKSTLLKTLIGIAPLAAGSIRFAGEEIARQPTAAIAQRGIGYVPQQRALFTGMTVADNVALGRQKPQSAAGARWDDPRIIWAFPRLARRWYTPVGELIPGERQMAAVARALAGGVRLLLLDEPFEGLSPALTAELFEALDRLRYEVAMLLVGDHDPVLALADRAVILDQGAVSWTGQASVLRGDADLRGKPLGT